MNLLVLVYFLTLGVSASESVSGVNQLQSISVLDNYEIENGMSSETTIDQYELKQINGSSLDDILKVSPIATTSGGPRSTSESIQVRGLQSSKLFTYVDGVKQNFRTDHNSMLALDPDMIRDVTIHADNSDVSKSGSIGGGASFTTKEAKDFLSYGKNAGAQFSYSKQNKNGEDFYSLKSFSRSKDDDLVLSFGSREARDIILGSGYTLPNSSYDDKSLLLKYSFKLKQNESYKLTLDYFNRDDNSPINPTLDPPKEDGELNGTSQITRTNIIFDYHNKSSRYKFVNMDLKLARSEQTLEKLRTSDGLREEREISTQQVNLKNKISMGNNLKSAMGFEHIKDSLSGKKNSNVLESYPSGESQNLNIFLDNRIKITKEIDLDLGVQIQNYKLSSNQLGTENRSENEILKKIKVEIKPEDWFSVWSLYSEGFNGPKVQDMFVNGLHHQGDGFFISDNYFIPNPELLAENSKTLEFGLKAQRNAFSDVDLLTFRLSTYWREVENYIYLEKVDRAIFDGEFGTTQFVNAKDVSLYGSEASLEYLVGDLSFLTSYSRVRGINKSQSILISDLPADQLNYKISYNLPSIQVNLGYLGVKSLKQDRINRQTLERTDETPSSFVHNVFLNKDIGNFSLNFKIDNVTNRRYRKHASNIEEVGRDNKVMIKYKLEYL